MKTRPTRPMIVAGLLLLSVLAAWQARSQDATNGALQRIYDEYSSPQGKPDISRLVALDQQLRDLLPYYSWQGRPPIESRYYKQEYEKIGISPALFDPDFLTYSGKLLAEAHARDPNSPYRSYTLYSTVFGDAGEASTTGPSPGAAEAYVREFPAGPFAIHVNLALAHFYDDLRKVIQLEVSGKRIDYKYDCYQGYLDAAPLPEQQRKAEEKAIRYYERALQLMPRSEEEQQYLADLREGKTIAWFYCAD